MKAKIPPMSVRSCKSAIAVIGMGCHYPGASEIKQLWENILAKRRQFRQLPTRRLPLSEYYDPDPQVPDKTYGSRAAAIDGFEFDWVSKRIPKTAVESTDIVHWLALEVALKALEDAGYTRESVANERAGVILGNTLTGEQTRSSTMRLRWPYVWRALRAAAKVKGLPPQVEEELVETMETFYKSAFSPITEDSLAGGLSNTIAGRICNFLNFHGGGYTVDGACSSSLIAVATAATALANGDLDLALAGGVDVSLDTFELIGFAKTGALAKQDMTVYDRKASGFIPGEGCGFVVLKRLEDARAAGDYVYAILQGWGISSDGKGGITAPSSSGQAKALRRAYDRAGYSPHELDFIEGHGTGTPVGDRVELEGIALALSSDGELKPRSVGVTSFKSLVGHTKAAAGIGGFIKAVIAVNQRVLPPTAACKDPNPVFEGVAQPLYPIMTGEVRNHTETLRAGISAMGFGGINCHATIESGDAPASHLKPSIEERVLLVSNQETELFVLSAGSVSELCDRARAVMDMAVGTCIAELVDLAAQLSGQQESQLPVKAAIIAGTPEELVERLQRLVEMLDDTPLPKGQVAISPQKDIWIGNTVKRSRVGFLFPGQGSQKLNMARTLVERYSWARELLNQADRWFRELGVEPVSEFIYRPLDRAVSKEQVQEWSNLLASTKVAQPAICVASLLWKHYLERLGIKPVAVGGHSLGELMAFQAAGAFDEKALLCLAAIRGQAMSTNTDIAGTMASLSCSREMADNLLQQVKGYVVVANINSPQQTVISGEKSSVEEVIKLAATQNIQTHQLPVSNAFHTQMVAKTADRLRAKAPIPEKLMETSMQLFSSVSGQLVEPGISLREHFANQVTAQVDFISLVKAIASECDLFVEVGPGKVLSGLANTITAANGSSCFPLESKPECDRDLNTFLGSFFVHGGAVNWKALYENRLVRPFVPASQRVFIENPCERPFEVSAADVAPDLAISLGSLKMKQTIDSANESDKRSYQANDTPAPTDEALLEMLSNYFVRRSSFLAELMRADIETLPFPLTPTQKIASDPKNILNKPPNEELVKLLSDYLAQRGSFLARSIRADLRTLPHLTEPNNVSNQNSTATYNGNGKAHHNGTNTTQTIQPSIISNPAPQQQKEVISQQIADVEAILVDLVVQQTGYPLESIGLNLQLLDDLNLDSIKAGELVAAATKKCNVAGQLDPSSVTNATLKEVAEVIRAAMLTRETAIATAIPNTLAVASPTVEAVKESVNLSKLVLNIVEERTGFLQKTLSMDLRLLDDLNLDSIKAADLVATLAKQVGVTGELDPSTLANATLADLVAVIEKTQAPQPKIQPVSSVLTAPKPSFKDSSQKLEEISHWVRNFTIEYMPEDAPYKEVEDWSKAKVLIVADRVEHPVAKALSKQLLTQGAQVEQVTYDRVSADRNDLPIGFSHYLAVLPQISSQSEQQSLPLTQMLVRLKSIATPKADTNTCIAYVQFGGGRFGSSDRAASPEICCTAAFARSLHLERSDLRVRVVDLALEIEPNRAAELVMAELGGTASIATVGYDAELVRLVPRSYLQQPAKYSKRSLAWSERDVILVTGGAKGITAECVLALAQSTRVKMALVGSSPAPTTHDRSSEVARTLEQFRAKGLTCCYYSCDITKADTVAQLVETINAELGAITGVIHGAGLNIPRRVEQVSLDLAQAEVSPKLLGAYNLCQALASKPPKLFVAFSSIIGVTGMPGNAWYGFANEALDIMLRRFETAHPETSVLSVAYSVWGEVGMGARMGSLKNLARMGIGAIPTQEGVDRFLKLFECDPGVKQAIVAARLGGLDTWFPVPLPAASKLRFIEQVLYVEPGVELKARTHLNLDRDLYVRDHIWRGSYLFPTVFGLEAMAQATAYVTGEAQPQIVRIENISLSRPVVVNPTTGVEIEIRAEVMEADAVGERRVKVGIRTEQTGFTTDHFAATLVLGNPTLGEKVTTKQEDKVLDLDPPTDLYGDLLFQGSRFQRMGSIFSLTQESSVFCSYVRSEADLSEESFAPSQDKALVLGDPYFRDVLLQSVQLTIPQHICLPVHIDKIELFRHSSSDKGSRVVSVLLQKREGREYIGEVVTTDDRGYVVERVTGYRLRILEEHPENPTAVDLAFPEARDRDRLHQVLNTTFKKFGLALPAVALGYVPNLQAKPKKQRLEQELPIIALALRTKLGLPPEAEMDFGIKTLSSGKPEFTGASTVGLDLSLSHCDRYCLCVVEETPQGCDIEAITHRTAEDWVALLSVSRSSVVDELVQGGDTRDRAATRIWSALEAVRKAFNGTNPEFSVVSREGEGVLLQTQTPAGNYFVVTVPIKLTRPPERMVAIVVPQSQARVKSLAARSSVPSTADRDNHRSRYTNDGPQGQLVYEQCFQASFKDSGSISRRVYFSQYFRWVGQIRELPMESIASQMLSDFSSGEWGMVTNAVSLRVLGEATSYDTIRARAWVGNVVGSSFDTYIEFCKVLPDDTLERLAIAQVKATWVRLVSYGVPSPMPFPTYLEEYLERFAAKQPATIDLKKLATLPLPSMPASLAPLDSGRIVYQTPIDSNRYGKLLRSDVFQTTLEESNLVGNVYYGNYFIWQGRTLDLFLYSVAPQYLRVSNPPGEMICVYTRMDYLREAMPFDKIRVLLYVQSVSECGAVFNFEFFREQPDGSIEKLHVGQQEVVWVTRLDDGSPISAAWPPEVLQALI